MSDLGFLTEFDDRDMEPRYLDRGEELCIDGHGHVWVYDGPIPSRAHCSRCGADGD